MKDTLYHMRPAEPHEFPLTMQLHTADDQSMTVTIEDKDDHYELWLYVPSTNEKAKILDFTSGMTMEVILGEIERKYESVFAHVVHHRLTISYTPGENIYYGIPPFP